MQNESVLKNTSIFEDKQCSMLAEIVSSNNCKKKQ